MNYPCSNVFLDSDYSEEIITLEMDNSHKKHREYAEAQTKVIYDRDIKPVKTDGDDPKDINTNIDEHKLSYMKLEIVKTEDGDSGSVNVNSPSNTDCPSGDSTQMNVNFYDCKNKVDCDNEQREYEATERVLVSGNDTEEESIDLGDVMKIEMCTRNSSPNNKDTIELSDGKEVSGFEKGNIDYPYAFEMDTEHKLSYKWLQVGKIEDVKEEFNMDRPSGEVDFDRQYSEQMNVNLNGEVGYDNKEREYDAIEFIKCDSDIKEEKTDPEDVIMDMEEFAENGIASGENLKSTDVSCEDNIEFFNSVRWHYCKFCGYRTKFEDTMKKHLKNEHENGTKCYHCHHCGFKTQNKKYLKIHFKLKHDDSAEWYKCQHCEFKTKDKRSLASHLECKHEIVSGEGKLLQCQFCDYKCKFKYALQRHVKNKHDQNIEWHQCQYCEYKTNQKFRLTSHFKYKHNQNVDWYHCHYCEFKTKHKFNLICHFKNIHSQNRNVELYQCCFCEFKTKNKSHLTSHFKYKHSQNAEWYYCPHCELKTKRKYSLNKHLESKHGIISGEGKLHQCQFCDYKCKFMSILRQHLKNKHSENVEWYQCDYCEFKTKHKSNVISHYKNTHSENVDWYHCRYCEFKTKYKSHLTTHFKYKHSQNEKF